MAGLSEEHLSIKGWQQLLLRFHLGSTATRAHESSIRRKPAAAQRLKGAFACNVREMCTLRQPQGNVSGRTSSHFHMTVLQCVGVLQIFPQTFIHQARKTCIVVFSVSFHLLKIRR